MGEMFFENKVLQAALRRSWWVIIRGFRLASWDWPATRAPFPDPRRTPPPPLHKPIPPLLMPACVPDDTPFPRPYWGLRFVTQAQ